MTRDDERLLRFRQQRSKEAIDLAMQARWQEAVRVNQEATPNIHACIFIVYAVDPADFPASIRKHRVREPALHHLGKLFFLPYLMDEPAVSARRKYLNSKLFELFGFSGNCRQLGRSNEGKISGVETKNNPFPFIIRQFDVFEPTINVGACLKIRRRPADHNSHA